jgi:heterodisulfide reductase subunit A-like polyferredoxin
MYEFKVGQLARILGVHRNTVSNRIRSGRLEARPAAAKRFRIEAAAMRRVRARNHVAEDRVIPRMRALPQAAPPSASRTAVRLSTTGREESMTQTPIGSVMVVGGGIAGIQATLDLADSGYFVYLVEKSAGIGGAMAQLDKTFPTNDCAM